MRQTTHLRHAAATKLASDDAPASYCGEKVLSGGDSYSNGTPRLRRQLVDFDASPEGHALRFNAAGKLIGVTILNARWLLEHEGKITITIPERLEVEAAALGEALTAA